MNKNMQGIQIWYFQSEKTLPWSREGLCIEAKSRKNAIFATFRFNIQAFPESGKRFFASKISNSDSPYIFTPRRGHFENPPSPYCVVAPNFVYPSPT